MKSKLNNGYSLFEILVSLCITSVLALVTIDAVKSNASVLKQSQRIRKQSVITSRVDQYLNQIIDDFDKHSLVLVPRITKTLTFYDGTSISTRTRNQENSDILFSIALEEKSIGDVIEINSGALDFTCYGYCPKDEDYIAISYTGVHEIHLTCTNWGSNCEILPLSGIIFSAISKEDYFGITKVIPIKKRSAIFVDSLGNFRLFGFSKNEVNENQPIIRGVTSTLFTSSLTEKRILELTAKISPGDTPIKLSSRVGRTHYFNLLLNPL